jgi:DNA-binding Xre family transcriptional regulator
MEVIDKICTNLNCSANDILEIIPNCPDNGTDLDAK